MKRWLGGKLGGFLGLLVITALVVGGLGWVTGLVLRLEEQQHQTLAAKERSQAETAQVRAQRLALWRLDEHVYEALAKEGNRPYHDYTAHVAAVPVSAKNPEENKALTVLKLLLARADDAPAWMCHSYLVALETDWKLPNALREDLVRYLNVSLKADPSKKLAPVDDRILSAINRNQVVRDSLLNEMRQQEGQTPSQLPMPFSPQNNLGNPLIGNNRSGSGRGGQELNQLRPAPQTPTQQRIDVDPDTQARVSRGQAEKAGPAYNLNNNFQANIAPQDNNRNKDDRQPIVIQGPLTPLWLTGEGDDRLVLARLVQIDRKPTCQVTVLDWPVLERELRGKIQDLLPEATLVPDPVKAVDEANQEKAMTALPVLLDPGPLPVPHLEWQGSSLRYGLGMAWAAAVVALLAVALGGWALLDLSERRIRFVSAVTHELRTPLTSLRLYLDMLTSGMVTEEKQKETYLHTLNAETDRLNRLVGNVLDFSRLESQRPRLSLAYITVSDLLYHVRTTWDGRCQDSGKELVIEDATNPDALLHTDEQMVQQILGNLIDNACKYSRGAEDPRLWVRARLEQTQLVLEVEDCGPGIAPRERRSIFRAFRRGCGADVTAGGVGLGLALAKRWAGLLGGSVTLQPGGQGGGACFQVVLPGISI